MYNNSMSHGISIEYLVKIKQYLAVHSICIHYTTSHLPRSAPRNKNSSHNPNIFVPHMKESR